MLLWVPHATPWQSCTKKHSPWSESGPLSHPRLLCGLALKPQVPKTLGILRPTGSEGLHNCTLPVRWQEGLPGFGGLQRCSVLSPHCVPQSPHRPHDYHVTWPLCFLHFSDQQTEAPGRATRGAGAACPKRFPTLRWCQGLLGHLWCLWLWQAACGPPWCLVSEHPGQPLDTQGA